MNNEQTDDFRSKVKKYLELENVSILAGAGTSFHLGAPLIRTIPEELKIKWQQEINRYFGDGPEPSLEDFLNCLQADRYLKSKKNEDCTDLARCMNNLQQWLYEKCDIKNTPLNELYEADGKLIANRYHYHEMLIKKILQRPNNLKRANIFTTNYDMAFDYALDNLGIHYINGFMGIHNRCFRPEAYEYDLYYPGQSVTGKVHRAEKVLRYFKLHGSLSWVSTEPSVSNIYGIKEIALNDKFPVDDKTEVMIYPCVSKKTFSLDLPYSELFRQFSQSITQPQSVLFCIGYSFYDEHINDIIKQALSIPSFTLIIANFSSTIDSSSEIEQLRRLGDSRIIILEQTRTDVATFTGFVENIMPDLYEEDEDTSILNTLKKIYPNCHGDGAIDDGSK